jgi:hypothetical protein
MLHPRRPEDTRPHHTLDAEGFGAWLAIYFERPLSMPELRAVAWRGLRHSREAWIRLHWLAVIATLDELEAGAEWARAFHAEASRVAAAVRAARW